MRGPMYQSRPHWLKRRLIPIADSQAHMKLYANFMSDDDQLVQPLIDLLRQQLQELNKRWREFSLHLFKMVER